MTDRDTRPEILLSIDLAPSSIERLRASYTVHQATTHAARMALAVEKGAGIGAIVTNGVTSTPAELIAALPQLGIICATGVGYEGIDLAAAKARGIAVTNGRGTNANTVADHAMGMMLAMLRDIPGADTLVREGGWRRGDTMRPGAHGKKLGILGLGDIGTRIARRAAGFEMPVAYHNRRAVKGAPGMYLASVLDLATWSDIMIAVLPGGQATRHLVGAAELDALGPSGYLINVGRGSIVDTAALITALQDGLIAGAALDVVEGEPVVPQALRDLPNVVLTPHMAGRSPESVAAVMTLVLANLAAHCGGQPVLTPVA